jgi:hypothetical protein
VPLLRHTRVYGALAEHEGTYASTIPRRADLDVRFDTERSAAADVAAELLLEMRARELVRDPPR